MPVAPNWPTCGPENSTVSWPSFSQPQEFLFHQHLPESSPISSPPFPSAFGWVGASLISRCPTTRTDRQTDRQTNRQTDRHTHGTASSPSPLLLSQIPDYSFLVSNVLVPAPNSTLPLCLCCPAPFCEMRVITGWDCRATDPSSPRTRVHKAKRASQPRMVSSHL